MSKHSFKAALFGLTNGSTVLWDCFLSTTCCTAITYERLSPTPTGATSFTATRIRRLPSREDTLLPVRSERVAGTCRICRVWTRASIITSSLVTTKFENTATTKPVVTSWLICCPCSMRQKHSMMSPITLLKNGNPLKSMGFGPTASTSCPPEPKHAGCRHPTISQRLQV